MSSVVEVDVCYRRNAEITAAPLLLSPASCATITGPVLDPLSAPNNPRDQIQTQAQSDDMPSMNMSPGCEICIGSQLMRLTRTVEIITGSHTQTMRATSPRG